MKRRKAREIALKVLYAVEMGNSDIDVTINDICEGKNLSKDVTKFALKLISITLQNQQTIDKLIANTALNWKFNRIAVIDKVVLRMGISELKYMNDIPAKVTINEAVELSKLYSTSKSGKFVNGILDKIARSLTNKKL